METQSSMIVATGAIAAMNITEIKKISIYLGNSCDSSVTAHFVDGNQLTMVATKMLNFRLQCTLQTFGW